LLRHARARSLANNGLPFVLALPALVGQWNNRFFQLNTASALVAVVALCAAVPPRLSDSKVNQIRFGLRPLRPPDLGPVEEHC
jgi:hypothetical protein